MGDMISSYPTARTIHMQEFRVNLYWAGLLNFLSPSQLNESLSRGKKKVWEPLKWPEKEEEKKKIKAKKKKKKVANNQLLVPTARYPSLLKNSHQYSGVRDHFSH